MKIMTEWIKNKSWHLVEEICFKILNYKKCEVSKSVKHQLRPLDMNDDKWITKQKNKQNQERKKQYIWLKILKKNYAQKQKYPTF